MQIGSKLFSSQCWKRFGIQALPSRVSVRASDLHRQGLPPLFSTNSHPVPPQCGHGASFISDESDIIALLRCSATKIERGISGLKQRAHYIGSVLRKAITNRTWATNCLSENSPNTCCVFYCLYSHLLNSMLIREPPERSLEHGFNRALPFAAQREGDSAFCDRLGIAQGHQRCDCVVSDGAVARSRIAS